MKNKILGILTLAATLVAGSAQAIGEGDIWQIFPCDRIGNQLAYPVSSQAATIPAGSNIYFKVTLVRRAIGATQWHIRNTATPGVDDYLNPLRLGIYVSGKVEYADYIGELPRGEFFTDVIFQYTVKPGDFALPIKLATESGPADDVQSDDPNYLFDPLTKWRWEFASTIPGGETVKANWWFFSGADPVTTRGVEQRTDGLDYALANAGFYLKTIDFDKEWEAAGTLWRSVHQGSTITEGPTPTLVAKAAPAQITQLYVWSTNEAAVKVVSPNVKPVEMVVSTAPEVKRIFSVATVTFEGGQLVSPFEIEGVSTNSPLSGLVLSAYDHFNYSAATNAREMDYVTVPVSCTAPLPPSVKITAGKSTVIATSDYLTYVTELSIRFTQPYEKDVTFSLTPVFESAPEGTDWKDYIRISDEKQLTSITSATNTLYTIPAGSLVPMEGGVTKKIYLFALRSDKYVKGAAHHLEFKVTTDDPEAGKPASEGGIDDWGKLQAAINIDAQKPVITLPVEGDSSMTAVKGSPKTLRIRVSDTYADLVSTNGYKILIIANDELESDFTTLDGTYAPRNGDANNYLYKLDPVTGEVTGSLPAVTYAQTGVNRSILVVQSPTGEYVDITRESDERKFTVTVSEPAGYTVTRIGDDPIIEDDGAHGGGDVQIEVRLSKPNMIGSPIYAFLEPVTDRDKAAVDCSFLAASGNAGLEIGDGGTTATGYFMMIDGCTMASKSQFSYRVRLRTAKNWDDGSDVASYLSNNTLVLKSSNIVPKVNGVLMGMNEADENGEFPGVVVAKDVEQTFAALIDEPGLADLQATGDDAFQVRWRFQKQGLSAQGPSNADANGVIRGNPNEEAQNAKFTFTSAGEWTCTIEPRDKDMTGWTAAKYTFKVTVVDQPVITVTGRYGSQNGMDELRTSFAEDESLDASSRDEYAWLNVALSFNKCGFPLVVRLVLEAPGGPTENPGTLVFQESALVQKVAGEENQYDVTFGAGVTEVPVNIKTMDGTALARSVGFKVTPTMLTTGIVPESGGKPANEYYIANASNKPVKITNVPPKVDHGAFYPMPGSTNVCAIGAGTPISWDFTDVAPDFTKGIKVDIKAPNGEIRTVTTQAGAADSFTPVFTESGLATVQITFKDADNGQISFLWYYEVAVAKKLAIVPHGPTSGKGTLLSKKYGAAAGLGEGRVYALGLSAVTAFEHTFNCGKGDDWTVYGYGYKVNDVEGGPFHYPDGSLGYRADRDTAVNGDGNAKGVGEEGYKYADTERDSFLYTWLQVTRSEQGNTLTDTLLNGTILPELTQAKDAGAVVGLPSETKEDGSYATTMLEAIFSKEYLPSDNMGDINQDGVPDIYFSRYFLGQNGSEGGESIDDLKSVSDDNADEDFLPAALNVRFTGATPVDWVKTGRPFTTRMEIRGNGLALNDATAERFPDGVANLMHIPGVKPDQVYTDPETDDKSTLEKIEYLAWLDFAAANGVDPAASENFKLWSPERPTDPTVADTDGDGFTDGYEYYFWYRAHVGYMDANGNHVYETGRRFDPRNPGEGKVITSAEIAQLMDPLTPSNDKAATLDSDNDGLPDLLEFELGTNPFDFDTDGDGLPDGFELMVSATDPLKPDTTIGKPDGARNNDGDAMAFTTIFRSEDPKKNACEEYRLREQQGLVTDGLVYFNTFAIADEKGDSDGVQWYASSQVAELATEMKDTETPAISFEYYDGKGDIAKTESWKLAATTLTESQFRLRDGANGNMVLAIDLEKADAFLCEEAADLDPVGVIRRLPVRLPMGTVVRNVKTDAGTLYEETLTAELKGKDDACYTAWTYGSAAVKEGDYGMLTIGRQQGVASGKVVLAVLDDTRPLAFIHHYVYQQYGFDPRTAWKAGTPLAARWGSSKDNGTGETEVLEDEYSKSTGYAGVAVRTRAYTAYDEFLLLSFYLNTGAATDGDVAPSKNNAWSKIFAKYTTNPRGPGDATTVVELADDDGSGEAKTESVSADTNGADSDGDGVPDGWELYVMTGPATENGYAVAGPESDMSPTNPKADNNTATDAAQDKDDLNELREFAGTDSCAAYAAVSTTIVRPEADAQWLNKFFPTDPWNKDTDGDGVADAAEGKAFIYGNPADGLVNAKWLTSIPGGGLNPCSVDTDLDGLPDGWENQFKGKKVYEGELPTYAKDKVGNDATDVGNPLQGYIDGMDGTVFDAFTQPNKKVVKTANDSGTQISNSVTWTLSVNRDYDHDGLENWQEYLVGAMRCWRYDDPFSAWTAIPEEAYLNDAGDFDPDAAAENLGFDSVDKFWAATLVDKTSPYYNPHLVMGTASAGMYFSRVTNSWDCAFRNSGDYEGGAYYIFKDRCGETLYADLWAEANGAMAPLATAPQKYISCDPTKADTDGDGLDDYYELFHGLNPLLGETAVPITGTAPCDVVFDAWYKSSIGLSPIDAEHNACYQARKSLARGPMDFVAWPWLNGLATADPDGDDIRNAAEGIMPKLSTATWLHTDPSPLWMTDTSYSESLTRLYGCIPTRFTSMVLPSVEPFTVETDDGPVKRYFWEFDGFGYDPGLAPIPCFKSIFPEQWYVAQVGMPNWFFSFEENEGYDSDHDGVSDAEEKDGKLTGGSEPQVADSPLRRQAMYFQGRSRPSALQSMPYVPERHPVGLASFPTDMEFRQYTVECWVYPETDLDATVLERAIFVCASNPGDEEYLRRNFILAIKDGKWYTAFDANGTLVKNTVEVSSANPIAVAKWTHLAATYDGDSLRLFVNGVSEKPTKSGLQPENGTRVVQFNADDSYMIDYKYDPRALLIGASFKTVQDGADEKALYLTEGKGWGAYRSDSFFQGYIDEIRIWNGARDEEQIRKMRLERMTAELAKENRMAVYSAWAKEMSLDSKDDAGKDYEVVPELRYHYSFDSLFGADNENAVAQVPHGFGATGDKAPVSRPEGWTVNWWAKILAAYTGTVYADPTWVPWVPNTVTHLPRFDGTTLDSVYWSEDFAGAINGRYTFTRLAEPVSKWTQMTCNRIATSARYATTGSRHHLVNALEDASSQHLFFEFTSRHLNQMGDDLLPLGGAYAKYADETVGLWDGQGASTTWEVTGSDSDNDGLPDWWETYADQNYRVSGEPFTALSWETIVDYHGQKITAGEAYLRDLAKGFYVDATGQVMVGPTKYRQTADADLNGVPDWWEKVYGITGAGALADSDHDGLSNYLEYMLSEVLNLNGRVFNPTSAFSVDPYIPDYFFRFGQLYAGEIFTDHDLVDDEWEDQYPASFSSRLVYDAFKDADEDGWCNRSEARYSKLCMPIVANDEFHYTAADGLVADYPVPTIALTLRYNGNRQDNVRTSPIVVKMTTGDETSTKDFDATFSIGAIKTEDKGGAASSGENKSEEDLFQPLGKWSNRHAIGTLTPGYIGLASLELQYCADPSVVTYRWYLYNANKIVYSGLREDYDAARMQYGEANVHLLNKTVTYSPYSELDFSVSETGEVLTWLMPNGVELGTINLTTGAYDLNLGAMKGLTIAGGSSGSNTASKVSMEDQTYRIKYNTNPSIGLPRKLYLGTATDGHVREGKNRIVAFADFDGNGVYTPGEPYGIAYDVDVSWFGTSAEIELTDRSPVTPRIDLWADLADRTDTRDAYYARLVEIINEKYLSPTAYELEMKQLEQWLANNQIVDAVAESATEPVRVRLVRWLVDGKPANQIAVPQRVVLDKKFEATVNATLTEADVLSSSAFDLDWANFAEVLEDSVTPVTNVSYLVVIGDGSVSWRDKNATNIVVNALQQMVTRHFGRTRVLPTPLAPTAEAEGIVMSANPTFKWRLDVPELEAYTAFRIVVSDKSGATVWNSGIQRAPAKNEKGEYVWSAPLYVGEKTTSGKVFANEQVYTWKVAMYNAKYQSNTYSPDSTFRLHVQTNGVSLGTAHLAVKYFGPAESYAGKTIRVKAYTSPDFTGLPVAAGTVAAPDDAENGLSVTGRTLVANCDVAGLPPGTYYFQAFVDSNGNGTCEPWESQGYYCTRDGTAVNYLNPVGVEFGTAVGYGDLLPVYLEDSDTDGDGLPDAWEYAKFGSIGKKGVELLTETEAGEFLVYTSLIDHLKVENDAPTGGLAGKALTSLRNAGTLALALGMNPAADQPFAASIATVVSDELVEEGVKITSLAVKDGKIAIAVDAETKTVVRSTSPLAAALVTDAAPAMTVKCYVSYTANLASAWTELAPVTITVGAGETEVTADLPAEVTTSGFFRVRLEK